MLSIHLPIPNTKYVFFDKYLVLSLLKYLTPIKNSYWREKSCKAHLNSCNQFKFFLCVDLKC